MTNHLVIYRIKFYWNIYICFEDIKKYFFFGPNTYIKMFFLPEEFVLEVCGLVYYMLKNKLCI